MAPSVNGRPINEPAADSSKDTCQPRDKLATLILGAGWVRPPPTSSRPKLLVLPL